MVTVTMYVWDPVFDCVTHELDENNAVKAVYNNEPQQYGGVLSQRRGTTSHYYHHEALGSTRFLTDSSGNVTDTYLHDAWGNQVASTGTTVNPFRWVGQFGYYWDEQFVQCHVRARPYTPATGQWTTSDPAGFVDGMNRYLYVRNNPVNLTDPSGRLFGYGYGNFCGFSKKAHCPPGSSMVAPIDSVDAACERHDCCMARILDLWKCTSCSAELCTGVWDAFYGGCAQSHYGNPARISACKQAATTIGSLFCWLAPDVEPPEGGFSPG
jgi:RHS repeat-associated protein